jgi:hypothetical protein
MPIKHITGYEFLEVIMLKQVGISTLELLLSLTIISSISAYTLTMSEEVEVNIKEYQQQINLKELRKKIQSRNVVLKPLENIDESNSLQNS